MKQNVEKKEPKQNSEGRLPSQKVSTLQVSRTSYNVRCVESKGKLEGIDVSISFDTDKGRVTSDKGYHIDTTYLTNDEARLVRLAIQLGIRIAGSEKVLSVDKLLTEIRNVKVPPSSNEDKTTVPPAETGDDK